MAYDCSGKWSDKTGPNAPLDDTCAPGPDQYGSAVSAVDNWTKAGFNASQVRWYSSSSLLIEPLLFNSFTQILLGVPAYGHTFSVNAADAYDSKGDLALYIPVNKDNQPLGPSDPPRGVDPGKKFPFYNILAYAERKLTYRCRSVWITQYALRRIYL